MGEDEKGSITAANRFRCDNDSPANRRAHVGMMPANLATPMLRGRPEMKPGQSPSTRWTSRTRRRLLGLAGAVGALALVLSACSSTSSPSNSSGTVQKGGTATFGVITGQGPTWIWPFVPIAYESVPNGQTFQFLMYRPLVMFGDNGLSVQANYFLSPINAPVYSEPGPGPDQGRRSATVSRTAVAAFRAATRIGS